MNVDEGDNRIALLSRRHRECLRLVYRRKQTKEIARELGLATGTVTTYCTEAIRILGARDRRDAAEQLHEAEERAGYSVPLADPLRAEPPPEGVAIYPPNPSAEHQAEGQARWARLAPLRAKGVTRNDLTILERLGLIVLLALVVAIGFGAVASGLHVVSDLVRSVARP